MLDMTELLMIDRGDGVRLAARHTPGRGPTWPGDARGGMPGPGFRRRGREALDAGGRKRDAAVPSRPGAAT